MGWGGLEGIEELTTDYELGRVEVRTADGRVVREPSSLSDRGLLDYKRVTVRPRELLMRMVTLWDEVLEVEVFDNDDPSLRRKGRSVVYLDQNIWIEASRAIHRPDLVDGRESAPLLDIVDLARREKILLPISSGHWIETGPTYGEQRKRLAAVMVGLSRGWIMSDPLRVAAAEMSTLFDNVGGASAGQLGSVFTLDHRHLFAEPLPRSTLRGPGLPPEAEEAINAVSGANATLAVLLETHRTEPTGVAAAQNWAAVHQQFRTSLAKGRGSPSDLRQATLEAFLKGLGHGLQNAIRDAGLGRADADAWTRSEAERDIGRLPYLGRLRELIHLRLVNRDDRWKKNDLVDVHYLLCAAAYADFVVCEKKMGDYLQRIAERRSDGAAIFTRVSTLMSLHKRRLEAESES